MEMVAKDAQRLDGVSLSALLRGTFSQVTGYF